MGTEKTTRMETRAARKEFTVKDKKNDLRLFDFPRNSTSGNMQFACFKLRYIAVHVIMLSPQQACVEIGQAR